VTTDLRSRLQSTLGGAYSLERELGGGGMSRVFVADDLTLDRKVVVKVVAPELSEGVSAERFEREVRLAARLQHANIVPVLTAGHTGDIPYYTMPFVDGQSLRARLAEGRVPIAEATSILRDVARALAYAHAQGVVHRDIKPENILLAGGAAVVTDFGIAKALSASRMHGEETAGNVTGGITRAGISLGTPAYMAPEQAVGDPSMDHRADLYAWGVVAWELIAGEHPFAGAASPHALVAAHVSDAPMPLGARRPDVPPLLAALVMRCLEKAPDRRPASAMEVLAALDAVGTPTRGAVASPASRARAAAMVIGAVVVLAGILGAVALWRGRRPASPAPSAGASAVPKSLVVLPFTSVGGDTANAYFAEGIADELTTALARLPGLRLAGRSSAARFKRSGAGAQEIGAALKVGAVLDGTVRRAGNLIRVSAELTSTEDGRLLWSDSYERRLEDVFAVQDDITRSIVGALQVQLAGVQVRTSTSSHGTDNLAAYDLYLRGLQLYRKRGLELGDAERYLQQANALDSTYARAYATLASVLAAKAYYFDVPPSANLPRARAAAERAVAIDPALPDAHLALGHVLTELFEWREAEAELRRAIALNPDNSESYYRLGTMLLQSGRIREAAAALDRAKAIDPFYAFASAYLALAQGILGENDAAYAEAKRSLALDSLSQATNSLYGYTMVEIGRAAEGAALARKNLPVTTSIRRLGYYATVLGIGGARAEAAAIVRRAEALPPGTPGRSSTLMTGNVGLGDTTRALDGLEEAAAGDGDLVLSVTLAAKVFDPIRHSARFAAAMRRFNLDVARITAPDGGRSR
jgi:serine/threonine-protein kinase